MSTRLQPSSHAVHWFPTAFWFLALGFLWFVLISQLRIEWTLNPQYSYGWAVPFLCFYLLWQTVKSSVQGLGSQIQASTFRLSLWPGFGALILALAWLPTRLVQEANPEWRLVSWALAIEVIGLTLLVLCHASSSNPLAPTSDHGPRTTQHAAPCSTPASSPLASPFSLPPSTFLFPVCFFLIAVPWPSMFEGPLIQALTRATTGMTVELLGWLDIPSVQRGNVIEIATGVVGIDEACSGIRSFQATLMIALFLGQLYRLSVPRRLGLVLSGFIMALTFNVARTLLLVSVASRKGVRAMTNWHDPAGVTILLACFIGLWAMSLWLRRGSSSRPTSPSSDAGNPDPTSALGALRQGGQSLLSGLGASRALQRLGVALALWILLAEVSVEGWYRAHEARLPQPTVWTVAWPDNNPTFHFLPFTQETRRQLRYDEATNAAWIENGAAWQLIFLRWNPGRTALHLAKSHTPEVCLTAAGRKLVSSSDLEWFDVAGLRLPVRRYVVTDAERPLYVFYCLWDERAGEQSFQRTRLSYQNRLDPVLHGLRNPGQRSLEIAVSGITDPADAKAAFARQLKRLIKVGTPGSGMVSQHN
jgi:exosortase/archaeosortase family protein